MKRLAKQGALLAAELIGVNRCYRYRTRNRLLGLCYHGVLRDDAPWSDPRTRIAVSVSQLDSQMRELRRHWNPIALSALDALFQKGDPVPEHSVFVTFDDGFLNNLTLAAPILRRYEIPATIFPATDLIGSDETIWPLEIPERILRWSGDFVPYPGSTRPRPISRNDVERLCLAEEIVERSKRLPDDERRGYLETLRENSSFVCSVPWQNELSRMLDWTQIRVLRDQGIEFGAHTASHVNLARMPVDRAEAEMRKSKEALERNLDCECFSLAYPFGDADAFSDTVVETAAKIGFRIGVTLCMRRNPVIPDPMRLDRIAVTADLGLLSFRALVAGWRNC